MKICGHLFRVMSMAAIAACAGGNAHAPTEAQHEPELSFRFTPSTQNGATLLHVRACFSGRREGVTRVHLPESDWVWQERLFDGVIDLRSETPAAHLEDTPDPAWKRVVHPEGARVCLRYAVAESGGAPPHPSRRLNRPVLNATYAHFYGHAALVVPEGDDASPRAVSIAWENAPREWSMVDSFGEGPRTRHFAATLEEMRDALFVGGDFRVHHASVRGRTVTFAVRGHTLFTDGAFVAETARILTTARELFADDDFPQYVVIFAPIEGTGSHGGEGIPHGLRVYATPEMTLGVPLALLLAHEIFHTWNGGRALRLAAPELESGWFKEGLTDYYMGVLALRAGAITLEQYVDSYNAVLRAYFASPVRTADAARVAREFWKDNAIQKLPYHRGHILGHGWDAQIRAHSGGPRSLDDVMRGAVAAAKNEHGVIEESQLDTIVRRDLPGGISADVRRHVRDGALLTPRDDDLGPCVHLAQQAGDTPQYEIDARALHADATRCLARFGAP